MKYIQTAINFSEFEKFRLIHLYALDLFFTILETEPYLISNVDVCILYFAF